MLNFRHFPEKRSVMKIKRLGYGVTYSATGIMGFIGLNILSILSFSKSPYPAILWETITLLWLTSTIAETVKLNRLINR